MKQKITLLLFMFLTILFAFGQEIGQKNNGVFGIFKVERQERGINRTNDIMGHGQLFLNNRSVSKELNLKSSQSDIKQRLDSIIDQSWNENTQQLVDSWKYKFTYDTNGNNTYYLIQEWDVPASQWISLYKQEYAYDTNENMIQTLIYYWNESTNQWNNDYKQEYAYDSNKSMIQNLIYYWNESINQWNNDQKNEYAYNANGRTVQILRYYWNESTIQWEVDYKYEYAYDTNENIIQTLEYQWNRYTNQWEINYKDEYVYDTNKNMIQILEYDWNEYANQWDSAYKDEFAYDSYVNITYGIYYHWNESTSQWNGAYKDEFYYNNSYSFSDLILPYLFSNDYYIKKYFNHMLTSLMNFYWDEALNDWEISSESNFYYSEQNSLSVSEINDTAMNIYPNPVSDILTVDSKLPLTKVEIFSILGQKEKEINSGFNSIQLNSLVSGFYIIKIYSEKGTTVRKLIKQ